MIEMGIELGMTADVRALEFATGSGSLALETVSSGLVLSVDSVDDKSHTSSVVVLLLGRLQEDSSPAATVSQWQQQRELSSLRPTRTVRC